MNVFLSASVPKVGRGNFSDDANPFLIQLAVRELATTIVRSGNLIWGGHPSITPMIWAVCEYLQVPYGEHVKLYQSRYFEEDFPEENDHFKNVVFVDRIDNSLEPSLKEMRRRMLTEEKFDAGVFIGGMEGVLVEYELFKEYQSHAEDRFAVNLSCLRRRSHCAGGHRSQSRSRAGRGHVYLQACHRR